MRKILEEYCPCTRTQTGAALLGRDAADLHEHALARGRGEAARRAAGGHEAGPTQQAALPSGMRELLKDLIQNGAHTTQIRNHILTPKCTPPDQNHAKNILHMQKNYFKHNLK